VYLASVQNLARCAVRITSYFYVTAATLFIISLIFWSPAGYAASKVFPPTGPCQPHPAPNTTYFMTWDGIDGHDVVCDILPTCPTTKALSYDGTKFTCVDGFTGTTPCTPTTTLQSSALCPGKAEVGSINTYDQLNCDGTETHPVVDSCHVPFKIQSDGSCKPPDVIVGQIVDGVFEQCTGPGCIPYICTVDGFVPQ
jgi:hypothetical protein